MEKIDAKFANSFGFELDAIGDNFYLYCTCQPIEKGKLVDGKAKDVVLSYESLPELFDSFSPDIAFAYAQRINSTAQLAKSIEGLTVEVPPTKKTSKTIQR